MATTTPTWYGVRIEFDHAEIVQIIANARTSGNVVGGLSAILAACGIHPLAIVAAVINAVTNLGTHLLSQCNANQKGIILHICWIGPFWCDPRP